MCVKYFIINSSISRSTSIHRCHIIKIIWTHSRSHFIVICSKITDVLTFLNLYTFIYHTFLCWIVCFFLYRITFVLQIWFVKIARQLWIWNLWFIPITDFLLWIFYYTKSRSVFVFLISSLFLCFKLLLKDNLGANLIRSVYILFLYYLTSILRTFY